ncbi:MAG: hypothetical protein ABW047_09525 [Nitrospiraceae bacterium]
MHRYPVAWLAPVCCWLTVAGLVGWLPAFESAHAAGPVEFVGTVVMTDSGAGKIAIKKDGGGTRFTFVTSDKTLWERGLKGIQDLKKDDRVVVLYQVQGSQYLALKVSPKEK